MFPIMFLLSMYSLQTEVAPAILRPREDHLSKGHVFLSLREKITNKVHDGIVRPTSRKKTRVVRYHDTFYS